MVQGDQEGVVEELLRLSLIYLEVGKRLVIQGDLKFSIRELIIHWSCHELKLSNHEAEIRIDAVHYKLNIELLVDLAFKIKILPDLTEEGNVIVAVYHGCQANVTIHT